ncbi:hypothetical protein CUMW_177670 [Citrus unshiu]|uniref:Uncharacterized protein n=1 Tax=Citrus unshiu TaxID=55188 RepID=A0A2H5PXY0_CITUN|nr:hypothetical protein CUMW_177670 [Citrus unshiu]
MHQLCMQH